MKKSELRRIIKEELDYDNVYNRSQSHNRIKISGGHGGRHAFNNIIVYPDGMVGFFKNKDVVFLVSADQWKQVAAAVKSGGK